MDCYLCEKKPDCHVPLLQCGCYCCPPCYCILKDNKIDRCAVCDKKLIRGKKRNK